jgi:uncharacterized protein YqgV (UPF0045/DUF77 family)
LLNFPKWGTVFVCLKHRGCYTFIPKTFMENIINLGIQIVPKSETEDAYSLVDKAIAVIQQSGIKHVVTPFETVMEGPQTQLLEIAKKAQQAVLEGGADEVLVYYRMQIRKNADVSMEDKTAKYNI